MSSPSDNGTVSSSGRSSPDDSHNSSFQRRASTPAQSFLPPRFWSHSSGSSGGAGGGGNSGGSGSSYMNNTNMSYYDSAAGGFNSLPRRTSFGTTFSNGGRLSALSALGMSPSNNPALYGFPPTSGSHAQDGQGRQHQPHQPQRKDSSGGTSGGGGGGGNSAQRDLSPSGMLQSRMGNTLMRTSNDSAIVTTPDATPTPSMPSSPVQKPRKRSVCLLPGPDGLCVESRGRRRSEA